MLSRLFCWLGIKKHRSITIIIKFDETVSDEVINDIYLGIATKLKVVLDKILEAANYKKRR